MFFLLVHLLAALFLDAACMESGFTIFPEPSDSAVGFSLMSGCMVGTGDDALKIHATNPPNQGGERAVRTTKRAAAFMGGVRRSPLAAFKDT
jgi:hypothetical protein